MALPEGEEHPPKDWPDDGQPANTMDQTDLERVDEPEQQRDDLGNVGFTFCNNGRRAKDDELRQHMDMALKKTPGQIVGMSECQVLTEEIFRSRGVPGIKRRPRAAWSAELVTNT